MSLHYLNGILTQSQTINKINNNAFNKGIKQMRNPEFKTPYTMNSYDVNDCLFYPPTTKKQVAVNGFGSWFQTNIVQPVQTAVTNVVQTTQTAAQNVQQTVNTGLQNVVTTTQQAVATIQSQGQAAIQNVTSTIQQGVSNLQVPPFFQQSLTEMWNEVQAYVGKYGKQKAFQPLRTAFLVVVSANVFRIGTKLAQAWNKDKPKLTNWWVNTWGGDINFLFSAIQRASDIKLNGTSIGEPLTLAVVGEAIAAATPVIIAAKQLLASLGIDEEDIKKGLESIKPASKAPLVTATTPSVETLPSPTDTFPSSDQFTPGSTNKTMLYVGIGGALLIGGYLLMKKKK
jgi:hypothetical protein